MASLPPMRSIPFAPFLNAIRQTIPVIGPLSGDKYPDQTINARVDYAITVQEQAFLSPHAGSPPDVRRIVHVDLSNSTFGPGAPMQNEHWIRGYYLEWVEYKVWLQTAADTGRDPANALAGWSICRESPDTSNQTGSISSSISWGFNANAGAFGDMPTAGVGANIGVSSSSSHVLTDYTFYSTSTANVLAHAVRLTLCQDGTPYDNFSSLVDQWQSPFVGIRLRELPGMAKANCPVIGQAVWMNDGPAGLLPQLAVHIAVTPHWCVAEGKFDGVLHKRAMALGTTYYYRTDIDFSLLK